MSVWDAYPPDYRSREVQAVLAALLAGECVSVVGLSGAGKSNLLGFLAHRVGSTAAEAALARPVRLVLVDCNRLPEATPEALFHLARHVLGDAGQATDELQALEAAIQRLLAASSGCLCLLFDRFDRLVGQPDSRPPGDIAGNLRALRDAYKYSLTFLTATRRPLDAHTELAELFYANTLWLGPLGESDARWNVDRFIARKGLQWDASTVQALIRVSWGYPSLLRAGCEAYAGGAGLGIPELLAHPAIAHRVDEFWADQPTLEQLRLSGLEGQPLLMAGRPTGSPTAQSLSQTFETDTSRLTAKEYLLLEYLRRHSTKVCEKDDLIRAVWPEDKIYERGVRDDSLAQLVRRLREKIEADPSTPRFIHTIPGRGYRFTP